MITEKDLKKLTPERRRKVKRIIKLRNEIKESGILDGYFTD